MNKSPRLDMTIQEASHFLGLAINTIYDKVKKREIPFYKYGKYLRFRESDLIAFMERHRKKAKWEY